VVKVETNNRQGRGSLKLTDSKGHD